MTQNQASYVLVPTGLPGLDDILKGGLPSGRTFLLEGAPGTGKTTLSMQFLLHGVRSGERVMLVSLLETREELVQVADSHGWDLSSVHLLDMPKHVKESAAAIQTVFPPGDVEFGEVADTVIAAIDQYLPDRLVIDSISQLSLLTDNRQQMRGSILKIRDRIHELGCTALLTSSQVEQRDIDLDTIVHGSILLQMNIPSYGQVRRDLIIKKLRGHQFVTGYHNFRIRSGGLEIYTWPPVIKKLNQNQTVTLSSGVDDLDRFFGGGLELGTACMIIGNTGAGKSTLGSLYIQAAAQRGQKSLIFCFDERAETFLRRCASLNMDMTAYIENGTVELQQVNVGELSPGEFALRVRRAVEQKQAQVVLIDSLSGYLNAMPEERMLMTQLHELLSYLNGVGVLSIMVVADHSYYDPRDDNEIDASYLADTVIALRHFEAQGRIRRCIACIKKRHGPHENTIREFEINTGGCRVGLPLTEFRGLLTGNPTFLGDPDKLLEHRQWG